MARPALRRAPRIRTPGGKIRRAFLLLAWRGYLSCCVLRTAWAAARRATGTRNGEHET
jgi:hypothetical protein